MNLTSRNNEYNLQLEDSLLSSYSRIDTVSCARYAKSAP